MKRLMLIAATLGLAATSTVASAACRDSHGRFTKCPSTGAAAKATRCKDAKGKFAKCGVAGAKPI